MEYFKNFKNNNCRIKSDYINVNIIVMMLYYSFAKGYHWGIWGKAAQISVYYFLELHVNLRIILSFNEKLLNHNYKCSVLTCNIYIYVKKIRLKSVGTL